MTSDARRQEILRCALRAFSRGNYMRVTIAELAQEAGISEPALYKHFASKKDLFLTLVQHIGDRMVETWREIAAEAATPVEALALLGSRNFEKALRNKDYTVVMFQAISEVADEDVRRTLRAVYGRYVQFIQDLVAEGQRKGLVPAHVDSRIAAWNLVALGFSLNLVALIDLDTDLIGANLDKWGAPVFGYLMPRTSSRAAPARNGAGPARRRSKKEGTDA